MLVYIAFPTSTEKLKKKRRTAFETFLRMCLVRSSYAATVHPALVIVRSMWNAKRREN